jgi:hypothetical protein
MKAILRAVIIVIVASPFIHQHMHAQLTVQDPQVYGTKLGYIDWATLVIEPHGGYVEQSLYLKYSDHNQYAGNQKIEITHRFTLPLGSVINDMWLWIGDTVIKARMYDTWTARHMYDSIVARRYDPAFLAKNGNTYELHVYPLVSGQFRKIKLNFISPTRWIGKNGTAELPLRLLKDNNAQVKPLQILFREQEDLWGSPSISELPELSFIRTIDTSGFHYHDYELTDVSTLPSLSVAFNTRFTEGTFVTAGDRTGDSSYFQIGIDPESFQVTRSDTSARSIVVGMDLSGNSYKDLTTLIPNISKVVRHALRPIDRFRLTVSGAGTLEHVSPWRYADSTTIDTVLQNFASSAFAAQIAQTKKPTIIFCDDLSSEIWRFPTLDSMAVSVTYSDIVSASPNFMAADIVASYKHGYEDAGLTNANLPSLLLHIDSLFLKGGRFLGFFDHHRPGYEQIETHYINGLTEKYHATAQTLFRQPDGNIGDLFPPSVTVNNANYLSYDDPGVKIELANNIGEPAVVSKRINNGLLVVSGIWSFTDDGAIKQMLAIPLLGVSQFQQTPRMIQTLLTDIQSSLNQDTVQEVIIFSNADSVISKVDADTWANSYLSSITGLKPVFHTINLLDGKLFTPAYLTDNNIDYYGSGYLLKIIADGTKGIHFETHARDWDFITGILTYTPFARLDSLSLDVTVDDGVGSLAEMREVAAEPNDPVKPRFFIGMTNAQLKVSFDVKAKFEGTSQQVSKQATAYVTNDTTKRSPVLAGMLGWEKLQDYFRTASYDTMTIVNLATKYNLLCDYTALIALEPSETNPPILNPLDESGLFTYIKNNNSELDSLLFAAFPNPFNNQTRLGLRLVQPSDVDITIYNVLGQVIKSFMLPDAHGSTSIFWDGVDENRRTVASGIYYARAVIREKSSTVTHNRTIKLLMVK